MFGLGLVLLLRANDAVVPVAVNDSGWMRRHEAMVARAERGHVDLVFIGDSITHAFGGDPDTGEGFHNRGADTWQHFYGDRHALNLGISGDRTQHVLWRLDHGELDGVTPKAVVVMIGTNNSGSNTAAEITEGVEAVVGRVRTKTPRAKVLLLAVFPRGAAASPERRKLTEVNQALKTFADGRSVVYLDIGKVFLDKDGEIPDDIMPDKLHPFALGYRMWAMAMEPTLAKLMHLKAKCTSDPTNRALVPITHNRDYPLYDWATRHNAVLEYTKSREFDLVWIGDSITHRFGGPPVDGTPATGQAVWNRYYGGRRAVDMGFGYDRTENVLWRIEQGELDGIRPKAVVVLIGTNNLVVNTVEQTCSGVLAVVGAVRQKQPLAKVLLLGVLPRGEKPNDPMRIKVNRLNALLAAAHLYGANFLNAGSGLVEPDGTISPDTMPDFLHPTERGYEILAKAVEPALARWLGSLGG